MQESQIHQKNSGKDQGLKKSSFSPNSGILRSLYQRPEVCLHKITCINAADICGLLSLLFYAGAPATFTNTAGHQMRKIALFSRLPPLNPKLRPPNFGKHVTTFFFFVFFSSSPRGSKSLQRKFKKKKKSPVLMALNFLQFARSFEIYGCY